MKPLWSGLVAIAIALLVALTTVRSAETGSSSGGDLESVAGTMAQSVLLVGHPNHGSGTAWVLSQQHRLLVTNAHVADVYFRAGGEMFARSTRSPNSVWRVKKVFYHPRHMRQSGLAVFRSTNDSDYAEYDVDPDSADLAILQLDTKGPELPAAWSMASPDQLRGLYRQQIGTLGFPGGSMPIAENGSVNASFQKGIVSISLRETHGIDEEQFLQVTAPARPGSSGSPVFLADGSVVATVNSGFGERTGAIRIDCLWELIDFASLGKQVALPAKEHWTRTHPWLRERLSDQAAADLVQQARVLVAKGKHVEARLRCEEAIELSPGFAGAYFVGATACESTIAAFSANAAPEEKKPVVELMLIFSQRCIELEPHNLLAKGEHLVAQTLFAIHVAEGREQLSAVKEALKIADSFLSRTDLHRVQRLQCLLYRAGLVSLIDTPYAVLNEVNSIIRKYPNEPAPYYTRATLWQRFGRFDLACADSAKAQSLWKQWSSR